MAESHDVCDVQINKTSDTMTVAAVECGLCEP